MRLQPRSRTWLPIVGFWVRLSSLAVAVTLTGCSVGPDFQKPSMLVPGEYLPRAEEKVVQSASAANDDLAQWWRILDDRELDSLVARARESILISQSLWTGSRKHERQ